MYKVLVADPIAAEGVAVLEANAEVSVVIKTGMSKEELLSNIEDSDALIVRSETKVDTEVLAAAKKLKVIARAGVGVDNIDVDACTNRGVIVVNAPDGNTMSAAEHTFAMVMALSRNIPQACSALKDGRWERKKYVGIELREKMFGILGMGRIGVQVAQRALAFGMRVLAYDPFLTDERAMTLGVVRCTVDEVVTQADFITVHTPLTKETKYLLSEREFSMMKPTVRIINCARGGIIKETALVEALRAGKVAGAAIDVFEEEPATNNPLLQFDQVVVTPHLGASTEEAQVNVAVSVAHEVINIIMNRPFQNAVNLPSIAPEALRAVSPYALVAERLGSLSAQLSRGRVERLEIAYSGQISTLEVGYVTRHVLKGILSHYRGAEVNIVNAPLWAEQAGLTVVENKSSRAVLFQSTVEVSLSTDAGTVKVSGTVLEGLGPRIVQIDGYTVDLAPDGVMIVARHVDEPGIIGQIGTLLGEERVNIASMRVGRRAAGGEALMVLGVDAIPSEQALRALANIPAVQRVQEVRL